MDRDLEGVLHARGRVLAPDRIDQRVAPDDFVRVEEQKDQEGPLARTTDRKQGAAALDLERAQQPELESPPVLGAHSLKPAVSAP